MFSVHHSYCSSSRIQSKYIMLSTAHLAADLCLICDVHSSFFTTMRTATSLSRMLLLPLLALALVPSTLSASSQHPLSSPSSYSYDPSSSPYTVTGFSRTIELGGATSKTSTVYTLTSSSGRAGEGKSGSAFTFALAEKDADSLSWIEASTGRTANSKKAAEVTSLGYDATR